MKFLLIVCVALTTAAFADTTTTTVKKEMKTKASDIYRDSSVKDHDGKMYDEKHEFMEKTDTTKQRMEDGMEKVKTKKKIKETRSTEDY